MDITCTVHIKLSSTPGIVSTVNLAGTTFNVTYNVVNQIKSNDNAVPIHGVLRVMRDATGRHLHAM
jgi:hypothetical protein